VKGALKGMVARGIAMVVVFWWVATGLIIAMQRSGPTRAGALIVATALAVLGFWELRENANDESAAGARRSFLGGAMLWGWVSVTFYGGYLTGFHPVDLTASAPSWASVLPAIQATLLSDATALLLMGAGVLLLWGDANKTGLWGLFIFWAVQQVAKLNVFLGVENPAGNFLPPHLAYLSQFFGPLENSWFLRVSVVALTVVTVWTGWYGARATNEGRRQAGILYATILGLTVLEIIVLGIPFETTPWDSFLRARDGY
jgi:putative photosynthetic complex assembly protein 2